MNLIHVLVRFTASKIAGLVSDQHQSIAIVDLSPANMVDEYDPLWLEFIQSLNKTEMDTDLPPNTTQSTVTFDSLLNDEEFNGPEDEIHTDQKKLRVSSMSHCTGLLSK